MASCLMFIPEQANNESLHMRRQSREIGDVGGLHRGSRTSKTVPNVIPAQEVSQEKAGNERNQR